MLISRCCTSTNPDLHCLVTTVLVRSKKQVPSESLHTIDLTHLHTLVAEQVQCPSIDGGILGAVECAGTERP